MARDIPDVEPLTRPVGDLRLVDAQDDSPSLEPLAPEHVAVEDVVVFPEAAPVLALIRVAGEPDLLGVPAPGRDQRDVARATNRRQAA